MKRHRSQVQDADLDMTSFMNLMIVLVPVLLLNMVFSQISVLDLKLPGSAASAESPSEAKALELMITGDQMVLYYPSGVPVATVVKKDGKYDYQQLSVYLQDIKRQLQSQGIEKKDIVLLSAADIDYQTIITTMDSVRSYKALVGASLVNAELFPDVSMGDAPEQTPSPVQAGGS